MSGAVRTLIRLCLLGSMGWGAAVLAESPSAADGGSTVRTAASQSLSDEDREVVENLELLESLDATTDLELLLEISSAADDK